MWASVLVGVFWRGEELAAGGGVTQKCEAYRMVAVWFRYKFMTWRWFCAGCFSVQHLRNLRAARDFDLSARESEFQIRTFCPHGYTLICCGFLPFQDGSLNCAIPPAARGPSRLNLPKNLYAPLHETNAKISRHFCVLI